MKKLPLIAAIALACAVATPRLSAQSAIFTYTGVPAGPVLPGSSFTVSLSLQAVTGGIIQNVNGLSYWFAQLSPAGGPYPFAITNRDVVGSPFNMVGNLVYPLPLAPVTPSDLGGLGATGLPPGTYFVANLTFSVAANSVPGIYTLGNTTSSTPGVGGRISVFNDSEGDNSPIGASNFNIAVVPEPSSIALLCAGLVSAGVLAYRRRVAAQ